MRNKSVFRDFYVKKLGFKELGHYDGCLMLRTDTIEIHFFEFKELHSFENYDMIYIRTDDINGLDNAIL